MAKKKEVLEIIELVMTILLILLGLFISYQLIKKLLGGSWETEDLIIGLLMLNIGLTFTLAINYIKVNIKFDYLDRKFNCLAKDFKEHNHYS